MRKITENIISIILPVITIFVIAFTLEIQPTGLAVYENHTLYKINGSISITLEDKIPSESYIMITIDDTAIKTNIIEFLYKSGKAYKVNNSEKSIIGEGAYTVNFASLGIIQGFEKGKHAIKTEIIHKDEVLYSNETVFKI